MTSGWPEIPLRITLLPEEVPGPGESVIIEREGFRLLVENTSEPSADGDSGPAYGDVVRYVPVVVDGAVVQHAAAVRQRAERQRVDGVTLCSRSGGRRVRRRMDAVPLVAVTCTQCRRALVEEGLLPAD